MSIWNTTETPSEYVPLWVRLASGDIAVAWWDGCEWVVVVEGVGPLHGGDTVTGWKSLTFRG